MPRILSRTLMLLLLACALDPARAALVIDIMRTSDKQATLTVAGALPQVAQVPGEAFVLILDNPFGADPNGNEDNPVAGSSLRPSMHYSRFDYAVAVIALADLLGTGNASLVLGQFTHINLSPGESITGEMLLDFLPIDRRVQFADIGSTGSVYWGAGPGAVEAGVWRMVPSPGTMPLVLLAMGVAVARSRRLPKP